MWSGQEVYLSQRNFQREPNLALLCPLNYTAFSLCACCEDYEINFMGVVIPKGPLVSWQPPVKQSRRLGVVLCRQAMLYYAILLPQFLIIIVLSYNKKHSGFYFNAIFFLQDGTQLRCFHSKPRLIVKLGCCAVLHVPALQHSCGYKNSI